MCTTPQLVPSKCSIECDNIQKIDGGGGHLMILDKNGRLFGCGWNGKGQLGLCTTDDSFEIKPLLNTDSPIIDVVCGWDSTAAIDQKGNLYVWGSNAFDQLGFSAQHIDSLFTFPMLLNLPSTEKVRQVCFGLRFMCILCESRNVYVVGRWRFLDNCMVIMHNDTKFHKIQMPSNLKIEHISSGSNHIICACTDGSASLKIIGFGDNKFFQCNEKMLNGIDDIQCLRSGWSHNGILGSNGVVHLWGRNTYGQLANSASDKSDDLIELIGIQEKIKQFHLGAEHGLVVAESNDVYTWGKKWNISYLVEQKCILCSLSFEI